jgi:hypothetical protein
MQPPKENLLTSLKGEIRLPIRIYRTDGSNRIHEAFRTHFSESGITVRVPAVFSVGEVVELESHTAEFPGSRERARVMYRNDNQYGLSFLDGQTAERRSA